MKVRDPRRNIVESSTINE